MCDNARYLERFKLENDKVYSISVGDGPSSIRDQIRKAARFIEAANAEGLIGPGSRLLVVGAGVTGLAASWHAVRVGAFTKLRDTETKPVSRQANCSTRWLHPYAYDWPKKHWPLEEFPSLGEAYVPETLAWESKPASGVARAWTIKFNAWAAQTIDKDPNLFEWLPEQPVTIPPKTDVDWAEWRKQVDSKGVQELILVCAGAAERCAEPPDAEFQSFRFWGTDPYEKLHFDGDVKPAYRILVSGGGDGALQDFLRVLCRKPNSNQFVHVVFLLNSLKGILSEFKSYHDLCSELRDNGDDVRPAAQIIWRACDRFLDAVDNDPRKNALGAALDELINPRFLLKDGDRIHLNVPEKMFGDCLPLNAFLVRLFVWRLEQREQVVLYPSARVSGITSAQPEHTCAKDLGPGECVTKSHLVKFDRNGTEEQEIYDVVLLRHGIKPLLGVSERAVP